MTGRGLRKALAIRKLSFDEHRLSSSLGSEFERRQKAFEATVEAEHGMPFLKLRGTMLLPSSQAAARDLLSWMEAADRVH